MLDHELVELAAATPASVEIRASRLVKEPLRDSLADRILDRQKRGFGSSMGGWLSGKVLPLMQKAYRPNRSRLAASLMPNRCSR
jgi:Asparagine synthase